AFGVLYIDMAHNVTSGGSNLHFTLRDSGSAVQEYGGLGASIVDNTAGDEDGQLNFYTTAGGAERNTRLIIDSVGNVNILAGTLSMGGTEIVSAARNASFYAVEFPESSSLTNPATTYRNTINSGSWGTLTRNASDAYLTSNVYYNTSDQWIAKYTTSNAAGYMSFLGGGLRWSSNAASVTAGGVVTGMTDRFRIEPDGDTYLITGALYMGSTEVISASRVGPFTTLNLTGNFSAPDITATDNLTAEGQVFAADGTAAAPGYSWTNDVDTGFILEDTNT
ncbi:uncharacterized protein METZ01_LOCUS410130, partial [marine metagenome]